MANSIFDNHFIYKKEVDTAVLNWGISVPKLTKNLFYSNMNTKLKRGEHKEIHLLMDGYSYHAVIVNQLHDQLEDPTREDLLQIRYKTDVARKFKQIFIDTYDYISDEKAAKANLRKQIEIPHDKKEYLVIYSTVVKNVLLIDCITRDDINNAAEVLGAYDEFELEQILSMRDSDKMFEDREKTKKIRKLDRAIGRSLMRFYDGRCQICGRKVGERYGAEVIQTHHIKPLSSTLNCEPDNILVVCPNHHHILHAANPKFNRIEKKFTYPNGLKEKLRLNIHI